MASNPFSPHLQNPEGVASIPHFLPPPPPPPTHTVIVLAGKLASKQRRDDCNTTLYLSPKSFDENNPMSQHDNKNEKQKSEPHSLQSCFIFHVTLQVPCFHYNTLTHTHFISEVQGVCTFRIKISRITKLLKPSKALNNSRNIETFLATLNN